jgi:toxin ParE1/3/4
MTLPMVWSTAASEQLAELHEYISESSVLAADRQVTILVGAINILAGFPEIGRIGRRRGTRELVVSDTPYVVAYRIKKSIIEILAVLHGAQRWPRSFDP